MRKGFTLIELLAVIVILAIIALITIPAVLKMTDNAKVSSYRRSIDLYGRAINAAVTAYKSDKIEKKELYQITFSNVEAYVDYEGNDINCKESKIYSDDTILLTECSVEGNLVYAEKNKGYGSNNYYYYTNSKKRIRVLEYVDQVNNALKGKEFTRNTCQVQSNGNLLCNGETIEITSNLEKPISGTLTINNNEVISYSQLKFEDKKIETVEEIPTVIDEGEINTGNNQNNSGNNNQGNNTNNGANNQDNSSEPSYIGYYADVDGNGMVDGVIYADLAHSKSGKWGGSSYLYTSQINLKEYTISTNKYNDKFGEKEIITLRSNSTGNARFYVMALYDSGLSSWYINAYEKMNTWETDTSVNFGSGYTNTETIIDIWNAGENGKYNAAQASYHYDIFEHIQKEYAKGWYIPSKQEWAAFADYLANREENQLTNDCIKLPCTNDGNYDDIYGLSPYYWSSSQGSASTVWFANFDHGIINTRDTTYFGYIRLGYTF